jgi:HK97 family phage major capsid protein
MKKLVLKIRKHTKAVMIGLSMVIGAMALCENTRGAAIKTMQSTSIAFVGLGATLKAKKNGEKSAYDSLDDNTRSFVDGIDGVLKGIAEGSIDKKTLQSELDAFSEKHGKGLNTEQMAAFNEMTESVKKQAEEITKLKDVGVKAGKAISFYDQVLNALTEKKGDLEMAAKERRSVQINLKAADSLMTTGYATSAPNAYLPMPTVMPGIVENPQQALNIMQFVNMFPSESPSVTWVNEVAPDGDAEYTAEGELKEQVSWKYENETANSVKITAFIKTTTQALRNLPFLANRVNTRLREIVMQKVEDGIINGTGTTELEGITMYAPGYTTTSFDGSVNDPQTVDALVCMAGQVDEFNFTATVAVMHPVDVRKMKLVKDADGQYVLPPFSTTNGTFVDNLRVVPNKKIARGYALVGDLSKVNTFMVENLMIDIGLDQDDFTKNRRTVLAEIELGQFVSGNEITALCYDQLAVVKEAISAPTI